MEYVLSTLFELPGAPFVVVFVTLAGTSLTMRIPPAGWRSPRRGPHHPDLPRPRRGVGLAQHEQPTQVIDNSARQPLGRNIITALWGNCTIKAMVGFLFLYPAFVAKAHDASGWVQLGILRMIGAAAAIGNFGGNFTAARLQLGRRRCWWFGPQSRSQ